MVGEFIGTTMFLFFAFAGTQIANLNNANPTPQTASPNSQTANNSTTSTVNTANLMFIALAFGFSLMVHASLRFAGFPQALVRAQHFGTSKRRAKSTTQLAERSVGDAGHGRQYRTTVQLMLRDA